MTREELILKAKDAKSAEELLAIAKENGVELTEESAKAYFEQLHKTGELADSELDNVSGGGCYHDGKLVVTHLNGCDYWRCCKCGEKGMIFGDNVIAGSYKHACNKDSDLLLAVCGNCKYCIADGGLLLCEHPKKCE